MRDEELLELMRDLDDPVHVEAPLGFDVVRAERKFAAFVGAFLLRFEFVCWCEIGVHVQDASFHGQTRLPYPLRGGGNPSVRASNLGNLASVWGAHALGTRQLADLVAVLQESGYVYVPERLLRLPYTGDNPGVDGIENWAHRFFDWV